MEYNSANLQAIDFINLIYNFIISQFHFICFFLFIMYYLSNNALISLPFPIMVFLYFLI
jgi:hypothetical protein